MSTLIVTMTTQASCSRSGAAPKSPGQKQHRPQDQQSCGFSFMEGTNMEAGEIQTSEAVAHIGKSAKLKGHVHAVRKLGNVAFVIIRDRAGMLQLVAEDPS